MANMSRRTMIKAIGAARLKEDVTCLGLRDKTLFKHGEIYEIVCDDRHL